ncbi:MAG TPA: sigma-70 family RNA polymerase sigma factor [Thermoanaerobaculia bacterium]|nr:sigma-70 family RNA polymerase sigma factor [Thermoanaerobaculia bacterium]
MTLEHALPDGRLIEQTLAGDDAAFELLVRRHQKSVYRVAWAILRDDAEADSVTQDTFVQAFMHLRRFERRSALETWLTRIVVNRARDVLRQRQSLRARFLSWSGKDRDEKFMEPADDRPDAERDVLSAELSRSIDWAVGSLSARQQVIFRLRHDDGRSLEEIASILGLRAGTVRAHLFRALQKLRRDLREWAPASLPAGERT